METLDSDFLEQPDEGGTSPEEKLLDFHFKIQADRAELNKLYSLTWKAQRAGDRKTAVNFLIIAFVFGGIGGLQGSAEPSGNFMIGIASVLVFFSIMIAYQGYQLKGVNKEFSEKRIDQHIKAGTYDVLINEEFFGSVDFSGTYHFKWIEEVNIEVTEDYLFFKQYLNQVSYNMALSKNSIGAEKFEEVVVSVQDKLKRIRPKENIENENIFGKR